MTVYNTTANFGFALPSGGNDLSVDVGQLISALNAIDAALHAAASGPAFSAYASAGTAVYNATWTKIALATKEFDTNSNFASSRFTPTVAGYYQLNGMVSLTGSYAQGLVGIYKNGTLCKTGNGFASATGPQYIGVSALVYFNGSTDYAEIWAYQGSGAPLTTDTGPAVTYFQGFLARSP